MSLTFPLTIYLRRLFVVLLSLSGGRSSTLHSFRNLWLSQALFNYRVAARSSQNYLE